MSISIRSALVVSGFFLFSLACSKSDADTFTGPVAPVDTATTVVSGCPIAQETYTQPGSVDPQWNIYYGADGDFYNAGGYNSSGMKTSNALTGKGTLTVTTDGATSSYTFNQDYFSSTPPTSYTLTDPNGNRQTRTLVQDNSGNITSIALTDAASAPVASISLSYGTGNLTQFSYQEQTGAQNTSIFFIDTYDGKSNPMHDLKGSPYLFYNWEYFSTPFAELGKVFQHLSTNNWTHYYCMQNGVKILEESITYQYNAKGYPTSGSLRIITYSSTGATLTDNTYAVTYTYPC